MRLHGVRMKRRISITLSTDLLLEIDRQIGSAGSRSVFIEKVLHAHIRDLEPRAIHQRDLELIDANSDYLNKEAEEVMQDQADIFSDEPSPK